MKSPLLFAILSLFTLYSFGQGKPQMGKGKGSVTKDTSIVVPVNTTIDTVKTTIKKLEQVKSVEEPDTTKYNKSKFSSDIFNPDSKKAPLKAALFAIFPGGGQAYNRKFWKLPIVYAGLGTAGYFVVKNTKEHKIFKMAYQYRVDTFPTTTDSFPLYTAEGLKIERDIKRRDLEVAYIGMVAVYLLTGVDAFVDAHLRTFDISDDLSMRIEPKLLMPRGLSKPGIGIGLTFMPRANSPTPKPNPLIY